MVNRVATHTGPTRWVRALPDADLVDGAATGVEVDARLVLLHRSDGELHAFDDVCNHAGALAQPGRGHRMRRHLRCGSTWSSS